MKEIQKWNIIKSILTNVSIRNSILHGGLCEEENFLHIRYDDEKEARKERKKALVNLAKIEKELEASIQNFRDVNKRLGCWKNSEIIWILTFFANLFCMDFRPFHDSQEIRNMLGDHMEEYIPLLDSLKNGTLSKYFKAEFNRYYYTFELKPEVSPEEIIDFILK